MQPRYPRAISISLFPLFYAPVTFSTLSFHASWDGSAPAVASEALSVRLTYVKPASKSECVGVDGGGEGVRWRPDLQNTEVSSSLLRLL